jgi:hypothetical protein
MKLKRDLIIGRLPGTAMLLLFFGAVFTACGNRSYSGEPCRLQNFCEGIQKVPGQILCACFDVGGEGITWHDADSINHGSGELNPVDGSFKNSFRIDEGVDISYTKPDGIDNSPYNRFTPEHDMFYVGWTEPGEWLKYSIEAEKSGEYAVELLYTSHDGGKISLSANNCQPVVYDIPSTYDSADSLDWRQWHHWNKVAFEQPLNLDKGSNVLTLTVLEAGQMNFAILYFKEK